MNLKEFRAAYPQYNDLDDYTLTTKLHKKFYADMDFGEFAKRVEYGPFDPGAGLPHEEQRLKGVGGQPQGFIERNIAPAVDVAKSVGGQIRTGLEQVGTPYIPGMLTEAESARPPMPLQPAHQTPLPYPQTLQPAHQPPPGPLEIEAREQAEDLPDTGGGLGLPGVLAPLAVAGPAWLASKVGKYTQYLPERGIGEDVDLEGILSGQVPLDPRSLAQREAQGKEIEEAIMGITSLFATEPQEQKVLETVAKPFEYLDTMLSKGVEPLPGGLREPVKDFAELLILIKGPKVAVGTINKIKNSNAFRMATVKERGLMVQDLAETLKKNPNISEGELVRRSQQYKREAEQPRAEGEITAEEFLAERERVVGKKPETVTASEAYIRKNNLPEAKRKLEVLKQRYAENGIESEIPKVEKAIAAIDEVMTEAPAHAAPEPDQVTPFPDQGPGQPTPEPKRQPTPDELRAKGKEIDAELEADLDKVEVPPVDEVAIEPEVKPEKDIDVGEGEPPLELKEQKKWLLSEVDKAIKKAPVEPDGAITFHVPGDGDFTISHSKENLRNFHKQVKKTFPSKIQKPIIIRKPAKKPAPSKKRLSGEGVEYYNEFRPRKISPPIELKDRKRYYDQGFYSDGAYIIKIPKSKVKKEVQKEAPDLKNVLAVGEKADPAIIVGEWKSEYAEEPYAHVMTADEEYHASFDPKYIDNILTHFPDAKPFLKSGEPMLYFKVGDEIVAGVAGFRDREGKIADVLDTPEFGARYLKIFPESKMAKKIGEIKKEKPSRIPPRKVMISRILQETDLYDSNILEGMDQEELVKLYVKDWRKDQSTAKKVTQQVEVEGEVITVEKPAGKRLSEIDEDLSAHKQLLDCIKALKK